MFYSGLRDGPETVETAETGKSENMSVLWMINESSFCLGADLLPFSADTLWNWRITWPQMQRLRTKGWQCFGECAGNSCSALVHFTPFIYTNCSLTLSSRVFLNQTQQIPTGEAVSDCSKGGCCQQGPRLWNIEEWQQKVHPEHWARDRSHWDWLWGLSGALRPREWLQKVLRTRTLWLRGGEREGPGRGSGCPGTGEQWMNPLSRKSLGGVSQAQQQHWEFQFQVEAHVAVSVPFRISRWLWIFWLSYSLRAELAERTLRAQLLDLWNSLSWDKPDFGFCPVFGQPSVPSSAVPEAFQTEKGKCIEILKNSDWTSEGNCICIFLEH